MPLVPIHFEGKSNPMTVITPITRWKRLPARIVLFIFKHLSLSVVTQLAFIHFARWIVIPGNKLPKMVADQPKDDLPFDLYVFSTNFNGSWDQYIDAFGRIHAVSKGLNMLWYTSDGFPGPWPMRLFKRYVRYFEMPVDLYYNAYPGASVRDIDESLQVAPHLDAFLKATEEELSDEEFAKRYKDFVNAAAPFLGTTGMREDHAAFAHYSQPKELTP